MRYSRIFTKTLKDAPAQEKAKNAQLLIRAGYVYKEMAGVYAYLPLGLRVVEKIKQIVREEMNSISGQEMIMTSLQSKPLWEKTNRWNDEVVDVWFKSQLKAGGEVGFGWSHEEPIGEMMKNYIHSYKDLPQYVYQFQTKLRNELRAKSGIMRGREFVMKDSYSFAADEKQHNKMYEDSKKAYIKIFERLGLGEDTYVTFAAGGAFTEFSHEFQTICDAGEDITYIERNKNIAINNEVMSDKVLKDLGVSKDELTETKTAEVGNIFNFGRQKAEDLGLKFANEEGKDIAVWIGSYGIGVTRVMGVIVEKFSDEKGIVWPESVAPYKVHLINIRSEEKAEKIYNKLQEENIEVLWDDREVGAGEKFADADLIGIPYRLVVSEKTGDKIEVKRRDSDKTEMLNLEELIQKVR